MNLEGGLDRKRCGVRELGKAFHNSEYLLSSLFNDLKISLLGGKLLDNTLISLIDCSKFQKGDDLLSQAASCILILATSDT